MAKSKLTLIDPIPCFMPLWTNALLFAHRKYDDSNTMASIMSKEFHLEWSNPSACLVGEINKQVLGYGNAYYCGKRCYFCNEMSSQPSKDALNEGGDTLIKFKIEMYNHMIDEHNFKGHKINIDKLLKIEDMVC